MKKTLQFMLTVAIVCGGSLCLASCKDDDNDNSSEQQTAEEQEAKAADDALVF